MTDTIYALATAAGRSAVAVVRVSGPETASALRALGADRLKPRQAHVRTFVGPRGEVLDRGIALWFPAPASFTGENCGELHLHGGSAVVDSIMSALAEYGLRLAKPGEFTRRAFENGKLSLDQAEAIADLIDAETHRQARQAIDQLAGALGKRFELWRAALVEALGYLDAAVDFPEEDLPVAVANRARPLLDRVLNDLVEATAHGDRGRAIRDGYRVALVGAPNAGKSSLLNLLSAHQAAIVSPQPGTTRDIIEVHLVLNGYKVILADTAGIRSAGDEVEREGVRRARDWASNAESRIWVVDGSDPTDAWTAAADVVRRGDLCVINKSDLGVTGAGVAADRLAKEQDLNVLHCSILGAGWEGVAAWLTDSVTLALSGSDFPATTRLRHARVLQEARFHLERALDVLDIPELAAEDVRLCVRSLGHVTGVVGVEDVLGDIFSRFCIGK